MGPDTLAAALLAVTVRHAAFCNAISSGAVVIDKTYVARIDPANGRFVVTVPSSGNGVVVDAADARSLRTELMARRNAPFWNEFSPDVRVRLKRAIRTLRVVPCPILI